MFGKRRLAEQKEFYERLIAELKDSYAHREVYLKAQISNLEKLVLPQNNPQVVPEEAREADAIISVSEKPVLSREQEEDDEALREFDSVISGEYD